MPVIRFTVFPSFFSISPPSLPLYLLPLQLLMCGTDTVSYDDLKRHAVVAASANPHFQRVVSWFWLVVSGFTREEMARLLQFVTRVLTAAPRRIQRP